MKGGGGVALYIRNDIGNLHCKLLSAKSLATDDILECVTMALSVRKPMSKTVTISCIYRTPWSNIDMFIESLDKILTNNKPTTSMFIRGDFNIDLLRYDEHVGSAKFIDTMYSNGLYPLIDKPNRITQQSAPLIDNIFTNDMNHDIIICGLFKNDISDNLPVFSISGHSISRHKYQQSKHIRQVNKQSLDAFIKDLDKQSWENTLIPNDVNTEALRRIVGVRWQDYVTNASILTRIGQPPLTTTIRKVPSDTSAVCNPALKPSTFWPPPHLQHGTAQEDVHHSAGPTKSSKTPRCP